MLAKHAREVARQWVVESGRHLSGFRGAFFHGSINWLPDDAVLAAGSDVDVMVVLAGGTPPVKLGKFVYREVLLEVSYLSSEQLQSPETVLGLHHLAGSFRTPGIIADPTGELARLQAAVGSDYAKRRWVRKRCESARDKVLHGFPLHESDPLHQQVNAWVFPAGITTHVLLVAALKNPTVRKRYVAVRELLEEYRHFAFYSTFLELPGCARMSREQVERHLHALTEVFDAAEARIKSPVPFASDISPAARPIAIDGSREMIERGDHREAIFWMVVTYSRCRQVLYHDAPEDVQRRYDPGYRRLLADLGITSFADLQQRREQVTASLPRVWEVAEAIMAANPEIKD